MVDMETSNEELAKAYETMGNISNHKGTYMQGKWCPLYSAVCTSQNQSKHLLRDKRIVLILVYMILRNCCEGEYDEKIRS